MNRRTIRLNPSCHVARQHPGRTFVVRSETDSCYVVDVIDSNNVVQARGVFVYREHVIR